MPAMARWSSPTATATPSRRRRFRATRSPAPAAADIELPWPRVHDLRHAYATHLLRAGLTAHAVARLLGHSDAGLVHRRYGHALPDELQLAGNALEAFRARSIGRPAP